MEQVVVGQVALDTYGDLFTEYVIGGVRASLAQVQAHEYVVPDAVREQAWHVLSFALDVDAAWEVTKELLLELAPKMEQGGLRETWIPYLAQGIQLSRLHSEHDADAELCLQLGIIYRLSSQHENATNFLQDGARNFARIGNERGQAKALNQLAYVAWQQHDMDIAEEFAQKALNLLRDSDPERAMSFSALGLIVSEQARWHESPALWKKAEEYQSLALNIRRQAGNDREIGWSLQNLANTLVGQRRFSEAIHYFEQALQILTTTSDLPNRAIALMNLGIVHYDNREYHKALDRYAEAGATFEILADQLNLGRFYVNKGLCYLALRELLSAEGCFEKAIHLYEQLGNESLRLNAVDGLAITYLAQYRYRNAYEVLIQAVTDVENIPDAPNYDYLKQCVWEHLVEAKEGLGDTKSPKPA